MTRLSDREFTRPPDQGARERRAGDDPQESIQDVELGYRASERLDFMEDRLDVRFWADSAQFAAILRGEGL